MAITELNPADNRFKRYFELNKNLKDLETASQTAQGSSLLSTSAVSLGQIVLQPSVAYVLQLPENTVKFELSSDQGFSADTYILCAGKTYQFTPSSELCLVSNKETAATILYQGDTGLAVMVKAYVEVIPV